MTDITPRPLRISGETRAKVTAAHTHPDDMSACVAHCQAARAAGLEISDGCARTIAGMYASDNIGGAFATSGAITGDVYRALFTVAGRSMYPGMAPGEKLLADMLGTYLVHATRGTRGAAYGTRPAVPGWSGLRVR